MNDNYINHAVDHKDSITKVCCKCNVEKMISEFGMNRSTKSGYNYACKQCERERNQRWRKNNPEKYREGYNKKNKQESMKAAQSRYYYKNKDKRRDNLYKWKEKNPSKVAMYQRNAQLKRLYGITHEDYLKMLSVQNGKCKICGSDTPNGRGEYFHVDHNHSTGEVRGLLCHYCNTAIGQSNDDISVLESAIRYLEYYKNGNEQ